MGPSPPERRLRREGPRADVSRAADWNDLVAAEGSFALTQAREWGAFKARLGWRVRRIGVEDGQWPARRRRAAPHQAAAPGSHIRVRAARPGGPLARTGGGHPPAGATERCARTEGAVFLKLEPAVAVGAPVLDLLARHGFRESRVTNQPRTTVLLDISGAPEDVLGRMRKKTRQYVRRAEREGITTRLGATDDLPAFHDLIRKTARRAELRGAELRLPPGRVGRLLAVGRVPCSSPTTRDGWSPSGRSTASAGTPPSSTEGRSRRPASTQPPARYGGPCSGPGSTAASPTTSGGSPTRWSPPRTGRRPQAPERRDGLWGSTGSSEGSARTSSDTQAPTTSC